MVARVHLQFHHVVALVIEVAWESLAAREQGGARNQRLLAIIRREPDRMLHAADHQRLLDVEDQEAQRRIDGLQFAVVLRDDMNIGNAVDPILDPLPSGRNLTESNCLVSSA